MPLTTFSPNSTIRSAEVNANFTGLADGSLTSFTYAQFANQAVSPSTPSAGGILLFTKTNKKLYMIDEDGLESPIVPGPCFHVDRNGSGGQTGGIGGASSFVKTQWTNEVFDTNNNFDVATNYRFTPTVAGKYLLQAMISSTDPTIPDQKQMVTAIYKNGSVYASNNAKQSGGATSISSTVVTIAEANGTTDYFETYAATDNGSAGDIAGSAQSSYFTGCLVG